MRFVLSVAMLALFGPAVAQPLLVSHANRLAYQRVQDAVDALPETGGEIVLAPGTYREKLVIKKNGVHIRGTGKGPADAVIVFGDSAKTAGGTSKSFTVQAAGDDVRFENLTIQNDWSLDPSHVSSQAVALLLTGDKAVIKKVRLLGAQDTLYANKGPNGRMARQYFSDCYVEGHVDFIFGNAKAYFERCELHGIASGSVMYTAQSKLRPEEDSAYVFKDCVLTADAGAKEVWLGRAWRPYATVIFLNTAMRAHIMPAGWREWTPGKTDTLKTATFAEYQSTGPGANPAAREALSKQLSTAEAAAWARDTFFGDWAPAQ